MATKVTEDKLASIMGIKKVNIEKSSKIDTPTTEANIIPSPENDITVPTSIRLPFAYSEFLKDYSFYLRTQGEANYSITRILIDALDALKKEIPDTIQKIKPRPAEIRATEQKRKRK